MSFMFEVIIIKCILGGGEWSKKLGTNLEATPAVAITVALKLKRGHGAPELAFRRKTGLIPCRC